MHLTNGRVIDPANGRDVIGDVYLHEGKIVEAAQHPGVKWETIDCAGKIVCPGLIDMHVHLREPGQTHKEDIESGSRCAAAGGFTTILAMPNTTPVYDSVETLRLGQKIAAEKAVVNVLFTGCITAGMAGEKLAPIEKLVEAGATAITDDGRCVQNNALMRQAMELCAQLKTPMLDHCQDYALTAGGVMHEGETSRKLGAGGWPAVAEDIIVTRNALLAGLTGCKIDCQHLSSARSVEIIREAKKRGVPIYAEAMPHHLTLTDDLLKDQDTVYKVNPPLRTRRDQEALLEGLADGTIEILACDHAPHAPEEKAAGLEKAPFGIIGLETELGVFIKALIDSKTLSWPQMIEKLTLKPAQFLNLKKGTLSVGADADVTVIDPALEWTVDREQTFSKSRNCPFHGWKLKGKAVLTIVGGGIAWKA